MKITIDIEPVNSREREEFLEAVRDLADLYNAELWERP